jgi:methionyl aminopeptidase
MLSVPNPSAVESGKIAARILTEMREMVEPGARIIKLCSTAERKIREYGGKPAFPFNVSINHIAAHSTSPKGDKSEVPEFGVAKLDVGVQVDGWIADTALTVDIDGSLEGMIAAADDALQEAIAMFKPGVALGDVGSTIESVIKEYGLRPISNLTGHSIKRNRLHAGKRVPNTKERGTPLIEAGEYYAIEPYATSGTGKVVDSEYVYIFGNTGVDNELEGTTEKLRTYLRKQYGPFPFASRWIATGSKDIDIVEELRNLLKAKAIIGYPMQIEKKARPISQSEHTVFVAEDGPIVLTARN